jgi:ferredoxin
MFDAYTVNTLEFKPELCTGCGVCVDVCPHGVFAQNDHGVDHRPVELVRPLACMECGACQVNCPFGAIHVESGVGCATAMFLAALTRRKEPSCG